jgi:hypothetical protein
MAGLTAERSCRVGIPLELLTNNFLQLLPVMLVKFFVRL